MPGAYTTGYKIFYKDMGTWSASSNYYVGEYVTYNTFNTYLCIQDVLTTPAPSPDVTTTNWVYIANPSRISDIGDRVIQSPTSLTNREISGFIEKEYFIQNFPNLLPQYVQSGLLAVGYNVDGTLGTNNTTDISSPSQTIAGGANWKSVSCKVYLALAIKKDGTLWAWGNNDNGGLGDNTITKKSSPVQTIAGGTNWKQVDSRGDGAVAVKTDGTLWTWGSNALSALGDNTTTSKSSPVQTAAGGINWSTCSASGSACGAIKTDGSLWTWGWNIFGALGDNTTSDRSSPVQTISGGTNWRTISCGGGGTNMFMFSVKADGTLWGWGSNNSGQLGNNTTTNTSSPIQTVTGGNNWRRVSCGATSHVAAIKTDGTLWTWGTNSSGQLGDNSGTSRSSPVQTVSGGQDWRIVSGHDGGTSAIKADGTLWVWGANNYGELGTNTFSPNNTSSPVQTIIGGNSWRGVAGGFRSRFFINDPNEI